MERVYNICPVLCAFCDFLAINKAKVKVKVTNEGKERENSCIYAA